jgi:hypothetical protein
MLSSVGPAADRLSSRQLAARDDISARALISQDDKILFIDILVL